MTQARTDIDPLVTLPATRVGAVMVLAHGAGAPMDSDYMNWLATELAELGIAVLRFEFPYMAQRRLSGKKRPPDRQPVLLDCWRSVIAAFRSGQLVQTEALKDRDQLPLLIAGKSMGGRMASLVADELDVDGLCCFGYPFHPPGKPDAVRTEHFLTLKTPTLIIQGTRDPFGKPEDIDTKSWSPTIGLQWLEEGDHDLKARKSSGLTQRELIQRAARSVSVFVETLG